MKADAATQPPSSGGARQDPHRSLHSETGALPGEHPGRSKNPLVKVAAPLGGLAGQLAAES